MCAHHIIQVIWEGVLLLWFPCHHEKRKGVYRQEEHSEHHSVCLIRNPLLPPVLNLIGTFCRADVSPTVLYLKVPRRKRPAKQDINEQHRTQETIGGNYNSKHPPSATSTTSLLTTNTIISLTFHITAMDIIVVSISIFQIEQSSS